MMKKTRKKKKDLRLLLAAFALLFLALALLSGWKVYSIISLYKSAERRYDSLSDAVVAAPVFDGQGQSAELEAEALGAAEDQPQSTTFERSPVSVNFDELRNISCDVIGWLCLPNTPINYPVVQGRDNAYYLERFIDGTSAAGGSLFADYQCPSDFSGKNTIIYGHNMKDGSMFALIDDYADESFYRAHPVMYLNTPAQNYRIDFFSGFTADPESFVYKSSFSGDEDFADFLRSLLACSEIDCDIEPDAGDRIVTLSTCTYSGDDVRFVLCGVLTEIG